MWRAVLMGSLMVGGCRARPAAAPPVPARVFEGQRGAAGPRGVWRWWHANGKPRAELQFGDGSAAAAWEQYRQTAGDGVWREWAADGKPRFEARFERGRPSGAWTLWFSTGNKAIEGRLDGTKSGVWTVWRPDGTVLTRADCAGARCRAAGALAPFSERDAAAFIRALDWIPPAYREYFTPRVERPPPPAAPPRSFMEELADRATAVEVAPVQAPDDRPMEEQLLDRARRLVLIPFEELLLDIELR